MNVLLLSDGPGISLQVLYCLKAMGARTHVAGSARARVLARSRFAASFTECVFEPKDGPADVLVRLLNRVIAERGIEVVVPGDDQATRCLVCIASALDAPCFPLPSEEVFRNLSDKWSFHAFCGRHGLPVPRTVYVGPPSDMDCDRLAAEIGPRLVVKPTNEGNSNGVVISGSPTTLRRQIAENGAYAYGPLIAQEFVPGIDVDCSILALHGRVVCSAVQRREEGRIVFGGFGALAGLCAKVAAITGFHGVAHFDARLDSRDGGIKLIECNPRFWASITAALWCGLNFVEEGIRPVLGAAPAGLNVLEDCAYLPWTRMVGALLHGHFPKVRLTRAERAGLANILADPVPVMLDELNAWRGRRAERTRLGR